MFKVKSVDAGYQIVWDSKDGERNPVPLAFEWDKIYTGPGAQSNAYRRCRQLKQLVQVQDGLREVGAAWWAGPYKTGKGNGKYYIHPNRHEPTQDAMIGFASLDALSEWIEERKQSIKHRTEEDTSEQLQSTWASQYGW